MEHQQGDIELNTVFFLVVVSSVNWLFLASICVSKAVVFLLVAVVTLLVYRPVDLARAGLYAIFCTQSNDFALGYPISKLPYNCHSC